MENGKKINDKMNQPLSLKEIDWGFTCLMVMGILVLSAGLSLVLCYIVYPFLHVFFMCGQDTSPDLTEFLILTVILAVLIGIIVMIVDDAEKNNKNASNSSNSRKSRRLLCCICGHSFTRTGAVGDHVKCPCCGTMLAILDDYKSINGRRYSGGGDNWETDYYDSDMEGAPGYYGGD